MNNAFMKILKLQFINCLELQNKNWLNINIININEAQDQILTPFSFRWNIYEFLQTFCQDLWFYQELKYWWGNQGTCGGI